MNHFKRRVYEIIEKAEDGDKVSRYFDIFILTMICLNILAIILESHESILNSYRVLFTQFEVFSVVIFTVEYSLRIWTAKEKFNDLRISNPYRKQLLSPLSIIDLLAILPFYLPMLLPIDLRFLRLFRITRFLRILKLNRYSKAFHLILRVLVKKKDVLLATIYIMGITVLSSAVFMYYVENKAQPENFSSITATLWWAIATLTTVGYGDVYPVTALGKFLATLIAIAGIGIVALPTGIISSGFVEEIDREPEYITCEHCGNKTKAM